jgi:hypothetical protein
MQDYAMIKNSKQKWEIGQVVNVGFMRGLEVVEKVPTPGDYAPDAYILKKGDAHYSFVPHNGLTCNDIFNRCEREVYVQK